MGCDHCLGAVTAYDWVYRPRTTSIVITLGNKPCPYDQVGFTEEISGGFSGMSTQPHEDLFRNALLDKIYLVVISRSVRLVLLHDIHTLLYTS